MMPLQAMLVLVKRAFCRLKRYLQVQQRCKFSTKSMQLRQDGRKHTAMHRCGTMLLGYNATMSLGRGLTAG
jgi:hypothetical protein